MSNFKFSKRSEGKLHRVHPQLVKVMRRALELTTVDFGITEGLRDIETQKKYVAQGKSKTMNSKHLPQKDGFSHAVDVVAYVGANISWDWPLYERINEAVQAAAKELNETVTWGGNWKSLKDGPHFQIELK